MYHSNLGEKIRNVLISFLLVAILFLFLALRYDFFYDLNDDLLIKDILAGVYTGQPEAHTNQLLYPLSWVLSLLYRLLPAFPVYGLFLCLCIAGSVFMISYRTLSFFSGTKAKAVAVAVIGTWICAMFLWELVFIQYSVVAGLLSSAACYWFYTTACRLEKKKFWLKNIPALLCVWLAFMLRSEMALFCLPFIIVTGLYHWGEESRMQAREVTGFEKKGRLARFLCLENVIKYPLFFLAIVVLMGISLLIDAYAYSSPQWKDFRRFFQARTTLYDYTWYPAYEEAEDFYSRQGISRIQYELIDNYNFGLDPGIDENTLEKVAEYNEKERHLGGLEGRVKNTINSLLSQTLTAKQESYGGFVILGYVLVIILSVIQKQKLAYGWKITLLLAARTICWTYLIWVDRVVDRIAHSLYMIEFLILMAVLVKEIYDRPLWSLEKYYRYVAAAAIFLLAIVMIPGRDRLVREEIKSREEILAKQNSLEAYTGANAGNYYYMDVYSMVSFTGKLFKNVDNSKRNYDFLGGWICHSPLQEKARQEYLGDEAVTENTALSIDQALLLDNFYVIAEADCDGGFLERYYLDKGIEVEITQEDMVGQGSNPFMIYKVTQIKEAQGP